MIRRQLTRWLPVVALAIATTFVSAPAAQATAMSTDRIHACPAIYPAPAYCYGNHDWTPLASTSHKGWVYLKLNHCDYGGGRLCAAIAVSAEPAWRWSGSAWSRTSIRGGWVYVYPYTSGWRWAWTQDSGWVAMNSGRFEIRRY